MWVEFLKMEKKDLFEKARKREITQMKTEWKGLVSEETVLLPRKKSENNKLEAQQGRKKRSQMEIEEVSPLYLQYLLWCQLFTSPFIFTGTLRNNKIYNCKSDGV